MKVYDCFLFFNELDLLEIRLNQHDSFVDYFVISESDYTFQGNKKRRIFMDNMHRFERFLNKIIYIPIENFPEGLDGHKLQWYQRQYLLNGVRDAKDNDLIIISDVDEILREESIDLSLIFDGVSHFRMPIYQFYLNMLVADDWLAPFAIKKKYIENLSHDCPEENASLTFARFHMERLCKGGNIPLQTIDRSGWHFTFMGGFEAVKLKLMNYGHANDYWPTMMRDDKRLQQALDIGIKIWFSEELVHYVPIDDSFPSFIRENKNKLIKTGLIRDIFLAHKTLQKAYINLRRNFCFSNLRTDIKFDELGNLTPVEFLDFIGRPSVPMKYCSKQPPRGRLISHNATATQSSCSQWSIGKSPEEDASRALVGEPTGKYSFHTDRDRDPWWEVDLHEVFHITEIRIFNRIFPIKSNVQSRTRELQIYISNDREYYKCIYCHNDSFRIGGVDGNPLIFIPSFNLNARYIKVQIGEREYLSLDKVYIYSE